MLNNLDIMVYILGIIVEFMAIVFMIFAIYEIRK